MTKPQTRINSAMQTCVKTLKMELGSPSKFQKCVFKNEQKHSLGAGDDYRQKRLRQKWERIYALISNENAPRRRSFRAEG